MQIRSKGNRLFSVFQQRFPIYSQVEIYIYLIRLIYALKIFGGEPSWRPTRLPSLIAVRRTYLEISC